MQVAERFLGHLLATRQYVKAAALTPDLLKVNPPTRMSPCCIPVPFAGCPHSLQDSVVLKLALY